MKLKNIEKAPRKLKDKLGKWYIVQPNKIIELENPRYDKRVFKIYIEKPKQVHADLKKPIKLRRKKYREIPKEEILEVNDIKQYGNTGHME